MGILQRIYFENCLYTAAWAGGLALAIQLLGAAGSTAATRSAAIALVVGLFAALVTIDGIPPLPVSERWHWVPWITAASLLLLFLEEGKTEAVARVPLLVALVAALEWFVLRPADRLAAITDPLRSVILFGGGALGFGLLWGGETRAAAAPMWRTFGLQALTTAGAAFTYAAGTSARFGQIAGGLAATIGALAVFGLAKGSAPAGRTGVTAANVVFGGLLLVNGLNPDFPIAATLLLLVAWLVPLTPNDGSARANSLQLAGAVVPAALAFFIAKA